MPPEEINDWETVPDKDPGDWVDVDPGGQEPEEVDETATGTPKYIVKDAVSPSEWGKAAMWTWNNPDPSAKAAFSGGLPLAAGEALGGISGAVTKSLGATAAPAAAKAAASPLPAKIAEATNISKYFGGGVVGRGVTYGAIPGAKYVQAGSDIMSGVAKAQKGMEWLLNNGNLSSRLASVARAAMSAGPQAIKTTEFILSQSDPEYQEVMKSAKNNE